MLSFEELLTTKCVSKMILAFIIINFISNQMSSKFYKHCQLLEKGGEKSISLFLFIMIYVLCALLLLLS